MNHSNSDPILQVEAELFSCSEICRDKRRAFIWSVADMVSNWMTDEALKFIKQKMSEDQSFSASVPQVKAAVNAVQKNLRFEAERIFIQRLTAKGLEWQHPEWGEYTCYDSASIPNYLKRRAGYVAGLLGHALEAFGCSTSGWREYCPGIEMPLFRDDELPWNQENSNAFFVYNSAARQWQSIAQRLARLKEQIVEDQTRRLWNDS